MLVQGKSASNKSLLEELMNSKIKMQSCGCKAVTGRETCPNT